jgi:thiol-disulfide isomerase/thioredoxin
MSTILSEMMPSLDVRSPSALKEMGKRIRKGPVTFILIYADWCGHCHQLMPHWDNAAKSPNRSVQVVKVNDSMLPQVNSMVNRSINQQAKPFSVDAYPTIIMVDNKGNKVSDVEAVKDTAVLSNAMANVGPLAEQAGPNAIASSASAPSAPSAPYPSVSGNMEEEAMFPSMKMNSMPRPMNEPEFSLPPAPSMVQQDNSAPPGVSLYTENSGVRSKDPLRPVKGGSLYASMSQSAYTLAPAAALFGMASYMMRKKGQKSRKSQKGKKTVKRRH